MFKMLMVTGMLLVNGSGAYAKGLPAYEVEAVKKIKCLNESSSFQIVNQGNPRNQADAQIEDVQGDVFFGGVWLWTVGYEEGQISKRTKYHTQWGGALTVTQTAKGCGRGVCLPDPDSTLISAKYIDSELKEQFYECLEVTL